MAGERGLGGWWDRRSGSFVWDATGLYRLHHKAVDGAGEIDVCVLSRFIWNTVAIILSNHRGFLHVERVM